MMHTNSNIIVTGAAGLVGQNLIRCLLESGYTNITAIDKHKQNLSYLENINVKCICADIAEKGAWMDEFDRGSILFLLQAQTTGKDFSVFKRNTIESTMNVLEAAKRHSVFFTVFVGSSVVNSIGAEDNYIRSKKKQEQMILESELNYCVVRPTLMFGWFDPKHFGWLSRFMERSPVYPIPGNGKYIRQPLYVRDVCRILIWCAEHAPNGKLFDIVGDEKITYIDIIRLIKKVKKLHTLILPIPVWLFRFLLNIYSIFSSKPPFVASQLDSLMAGDVFTGENIRYAFDIEPTSFVSAIEETFCHPQYSTIILERV